MKGRYIYVLLFIIELNCFNKCFSQGFAVNPAGNYAGSSAMLDVSGASYGVLVNRMTTAERNAIVSPAQSLVIYNLTTKCFEFYENGIWNKLGCSCKTLTSPAAGTHIALADQITWAWGQVSGAAGYKYNTVNDYNTAVDLGNVLTYTQTGLACNTLYNLYIWAYNICGNSAVVILNETTSACPYPCGTGTVTFTYRGATVTYGTVQSQAGTCWLDRNLGASQVATAYNDALAYGDLFQWGRGDDGHQLRTSSVTSTLSTTDVPGHSYFIKTTYPNKNWRSPGNDNLWQGAAGINNPCPAGWRLPVKEEFLDELFTWGPDNNWTGAFNSPLKFTFAGMRDDQGSVVYYGNDLFAKGLYWCSTILVTVNNQNLTGSFPYSMSFDKWNSNLVMGNAKSWGFSVRCIKD